MTQAIYVSEEVFGRLNRAAEALQRPVAEVAERALATGLPPDVLDVPAEFRADLLALERLPDDALWQAVRSSTPAASWSRHAALLERNAQGQLTGDEQRELSHAREAADRRLIRRAHAAALLRWRGHAVPPNL
jgi:hypothetical protein